jgi:hypothetical protein
MGLSKRISLIPFALIAYISESLYNLPKPIMTPRYRLRGNNISSEISDLRNVS